jgi:hypothetical protein
VHEAVPSVRTVAPDVDERIADWLGKMLAKRPEERFQSADEAWVALEDVIIEILGPRWRREARLVLDTETPRAGRTLTPAAFGTVSPADASAPGPDTPAPGAPVPETLSGPAAEAPPTIAPTRRRPRSNTTMFRTARRHRDSGEDDGPVSPDVLRRRMVALAIVGAMVIAAVAGVLLAGSGGTVHHGPTKAQLQAQAKAAAARHRQAVAQAAALANANKQLTTIMHNLAKTRITNLIRALNESNPSKQTKDAATVQRAYKAAAGKVSPLVGSSPEAKPLLATLKITAADYDKAVTAGRANSPSRWSRAFTAIKRDDKTLQGEVGKL